jgi:hypothetical protein
MGNYDVITAAEIFIHKILCSFGLHDYDEDATLSFLQSKIQDKKVKVLSCFYCNKKMEKVQ